jgi:hypothetical protein
VREINERTTKIGVVEVVLLSSEVDQIPMCVIDEFCISRGLIFFMICLMLQYFATYVPVPYGGYS